MKKFTLLLLLLGFTVSLQAKVIPLSAEDDWAPWSSRDPKTNQAVGISVDLVRKQFEAMNVTLDFKSVPFSRCLIEAELGKTLGCFHTAKTTENEKKFYFPKYPLVEDDVIVLSLKSEPKIQNIQQLNNKRIGVTLGYAYSPEFDSQSNIIRETCKSDLNLIRMLATGRVKHIAIFKEALNNVLKENLEIKKESYNQFHAGKARFYLAFSKTYPNAKKYLAEYDKASQGNFKISTTVK